MLSSLNGGNKAIHNGKKSNSENILGLIMNTGQNKNTVNALIPIIWRLALVLQTTTKAQIKR
jgi:hypothetical protein